MTDFESRRPDSPTRPLAVRRAARIFKTGQELWRLAHVEDMMPSALPEAEVDTWRQPERGPVFVLSAGWRSGSTALQRLIISGATAFVWGEPYPTSRVLPRLQRIAAEAAVLDARPQRVVTSAEIGAGLSRAWMATTNPEATFIMAGIRSFMTATYWGPLVSTTFSTWGAKEVVATPEQLDLLVTAFPDAEFVCVVREPGVAYESFREFVVAGVAPSGRGNAQLSWVRGPYGYARNWKRMAGWFRDRRELPNFHVFRYEDINGSSRFVSDLSARLSMELDPEAWAARVGAVHPHRAGMLARAEASVVRQLTSVESAKWGY